MRWRRVVNVAGGLQASDGTACVTVSSSLVLLGTQTRMASPTINLSAYSAANPAVLTFDRSYALRPVTANDYLSVQFSTDCGLTWLNQRNFFSADLNTKDTLRV